MCILVYLCINCDTNWQCYEILPFLDMCVGQDRIQGKIAGGEKFPKGVHLVRTSTSHPEKVCRRRKIFKKWLNRKKRAVLGLNCFILLY